MIIYKEGYWSCFHCDIDYPNTLLYCPKCEGAKKHSENMRRTLGFEGSTKALRPRRDGDSSHSENITSFKEVLKEYDKFKKTMERACKKLFYLGLKALVFDENKKNNRFSFKEGKFIYSIRRSRVNG